MDLIAKAVERNTVKTVKRAAIAADQAAVLRTPVDKGRARANWVVSIGVPRFGIVSEGPGGGKGAAGAAANESLERARSTILGYRLGSGGIFITNSVPYIGKLDAGSSAQAPEGMTAAAIAAARRQLGEARLLDGV